MSMNDMSVYDVDELMTQTRKLAAKYYHATKQILPVSGELAKYDAVRLLNLTEVTEPQTGVDAIDQNNTQILIKSRVIFDESKSGQRIGQLKTDGHWQAVVLVLFDKDYQPLSIYRTSRQEIESTIDRAQASKRSNRGIMSVARFKSISQLVWPTSDGS